MWQKYISSFQISRHTSEYKDSVAFEHTKRDSLQINQIPKRGTKNIFSYDIFEINVWVLIHRDRSKYTPTQSSL